MKVQPHWFNAKCDKRIKVLINPKWVFSDSDRAKKVS